MVTLVGYQPVEPFISLQMMGIQFPLIKECQSSLQSKGISNFLKTMVNEGYLSTN